MSISLYLSKIYIPFYVLFLLAALFFSIVSYRRIKDELRKLWLTLFIILRTLLFFLIFSALFSLIVEFRFSKPEKPSVYVLLDSSGSMDQREDGISRKKEAMQLAKEKIIPSLEKKANTRFFLFSDKIYSPEDSVEINKGTTMIGDVLKRISNIKEKPPQAVFIISDGRNTSGEDPVEIAGKLAFPIFSIKVGKHIKENNVKISDIRVNPIVYKGDSVPVTIILNNNGMVKKNLAVEIKKSGRIVSKEKIPLLVAGIDYPVKLTFIPQKAGIENFDVKITLYKDETNREDNKSNFAVKVLKKRKTVVLLTYQLNWDYRFLRDFLKSQNDVEFTGFSRIGNNRFLIQQNNVEKKGNLNYEKIMNSDILILINPKPIGQNLFSQIKKRISQKGMGLLIIGNSIPNFSTFRDVYPFITSGNTLSGDFQPTITQSGQISPIFKIDGHLPPSLPPLSNPLQTQMVKPITKVYLEGKKNGSYNIPLFGALNYGKGKIAVFTAENLWYWKMLPLVTENKPNLYDNVMNNILKLLVARKEEKQIMLYMKKTKFLWGEPIIISATLYDEMMHPKEGGMIVLHLKKDNKPVGDFMMTDAGEGNYEKTITKLEPGKYLVQAEVKFPEDVRKRPALNFEIAPQEIENLNIEPDHFLLDNISVASGGKSFTQVHILEGLKQLNFKPFIHSTGKKFHFTRSFLVLLFISFLFLLELFLRKLKGLK